MDPAMWNNLADQSKSIDILLQKFVEHDSAQVKTVSYLCIYYCQLSCCEDLT
jgi:hypothetical protein